MTVSIRISTFVLFGRIGDALPGFLGLTTGCRFLPAAMAVAPSSGRLLVDEKLQRRQRAAPITPSLGRTAMSVKRTPSH